MRVIGRALTRSTAGVSRAREVPRVEQGGLAAKIGLVFKRVAGGELIYQGGRESIEAFELMDTVFTIGNMKLLLAERGVEVREIFTERGYSVDEVIQKSYDIIAKDVAEAERDSCPLVYVSEREVQGIAELVGAAEVTEVQWERAAAGTDGKLRPWGDDLDHDKAVYWQGQENAGTRPVKSKAEGINPEEGIFDLIGLVWEWTEGAVIRGGSWESIRSRLLEAGYRSEYRPGDRDDFMGFRLARTLK